MTKLLLTLHVLAAILAVGPVAVAASMFGPAARRAAESPDDVRARSTVGLLHRICRVYAGVGIAVPVLGLATAGVMGVMGDAWVIASLVLTMLAAAALIVFVLPGQERLVEGGGGGGEGVAAATGRLAMTTGIFNVLWVAVTVLMIVRPGSTTGA
ncbi:hypothetical protein [Streptomyces kanamyceticus]|uniref:DUF2269 family protein n=1 Tax=Streptomyces kanamyceticus TaxID=1967 RepID=A0A5J6GNN3_STRKN|nr:hypothetical protein [Streptomyces kanamyceticus]QEU95605.1 hypothetical protein CP970_35935 [Streptomyces kanamyceticus]